MTTPQQIGNNGQIPANWTQKDIQNSGLPRYAADDLDGIVSELSNGAGFTLVQGLAPTPEVISDVEECGIRLQKFGQDLGRLLPQNSEQEQLVEISDFSDEDEFDDRGYRSPGELTPHTDPPPIIALLCLRPAHSGGANRVLVFDHTLRTAEQARQQADRVRKAVYSVHNDYTERSAPQRVRDFLPEDEAEAAQELKRAVAAKPARAAAKPVGQ